ncbi:MAG: hypothetical protein JXA24_07320 [Proteobacteria bacterium]|nr:hypothetical protein [Pseudomonadota bacterium]
MRIRVERGAACLELAAMAPVAALVIVVAFQLARLFSTTVAHVAEAEAMAARAVRRWETVHASSGFARPCLEGMDRISFGAGGEPLSLGVGPMRADIAVPQEVRVVDEEICVH